MDLLPCSKKSGELTAEVVNEKCRMLPLHHVGFLPTYDKAFELQEGTAYPFPA